MPEKVVAILDKHVANSEPHSFKAFGISDVERERTCPRKQFKICFQIQLQFGDGLVAQLRQALIELLMLAEVRRLLRNVEIHVFLQ